MNILNTLAYSLSDFQLLFNTYLNPPAVYLDETILTLIKNEAIYSKIMKYNDAWDFQV